MPDGVEGPGRKAKFKAQECTAEKAGPQKESEKGRDGDRETDRKREERKTDRQTGRQAGRQAGRQHSEVLRAAMWPHRVRE